MNDKNSNPWGYFITGKSTASSKNLYPDQKKPKIQKSKIEDILMEANLEQQFLQENKNHENPMILLDLLGRLIWMNDEFSNLYFKSDADLLERFSEEYGNEVFSETLTQVLKKLPKVDSYPDFDFYRIESKSKKPFGYLITFKTLVQIPTNKTRTEFTNEILKRVGLSIDLLEEKYEGEKKCILYITMSGRFIWFNEYFCSVTKRTLEKDFMANGVYTLIKLNQHNAFLCENMRKFMELREESFQFSSEVFIKYGGKGIGKYSFKRLDSEEGIPIIYYCEIQVLSLEK